METGKKYIAELTVPELDDVVRAYLGEQQITIVRYLKTLNMVIVQSEKELLSTEVKYLKNIEENETIAKAKKK